RPKPFTSDRKDRMAITKEKLLAMTDEHTKEVPVGTNGDFVVIGRIKLAQRNAILKGRRADDSLDSNLEFSKLLLAVGIIEPKLTAEEIDELPASVVDQISQELMRFNGWTKEGQAQVADHFRPTS